MTTLRPFVADDLFKFNHINLDPLTETYSVQFYMVNSHLILHIEFEMEIIPLNGADITLFSMRRSNIWQHGPEFADLMKMQTDDSWDIF